MIRAGPDQPATNGKPVAEMLLHPATSARFLIIATILTPLRMLLLPTRHSGKTATPLVLYCLRSVRHRTVSVNMGSHAQFWQKLCPHLEWVAFLPLFHWQSHQTIGPRRM
jgi:hypothetical protein